MLEMQIIMRYIFTPSKWIAVVHFEAKIHEYNSFQTKNVKKTRGEQYFIRTVTNDAFYKL